MKNYFWTISAVLSLALCCGAPAQAAPSFFVYQGRYLSAGVPANGNTPVEFRVTNGGAVACATPGNPVTGPVFWTSGSTSTFMSNGLFSYKIGYQRDGVTPDTAFTTINWGSGTYYLDVCAGGVALTPPDLIGSSPYTLYASSAGFAAYVGSALFATTNTWSASQIYGSEVVIATEAYFSAGRLNLGGRSIVNVGTPASLNDAANKNYVDIATNTLASGAAAVAAASFHNFIASQTFSGEVTFATEAYFSAGRLNLGGNSIVNVSAPVGLSDAANKNYVDVATANAVASIVASLAPQVVSLNFGSFGGGNYTLSGTASAALIVDLSGDLLGGNALTITLPAVTQGQEIKVIVVVGPTAGTDSIAIIGSANGGFPCSITGLTSAGPGGGSSAWLDMIGYTGGGGGWACFTK